MNRNLLHRPRSERLDRLLDLHWLLAPAAVLVLALASALVVPAVPPAGVAPAADAASAAPPAAEPPTDHLPETRDAPPYPIAP